MLDALPEEEKSRLEGERGELLEKMDLIDNLLLKESTSEVLERLREREEWREERKLATWSMVEGSSVRMTMSSR
jgi:hypothetical protein